VPGAAAALQGDATRGIALLFAIDLDSYCHAIHSIIQQWVSIYASELVAALSFLVSLQILGKREHALVSSAIAAFIISISGQMLVSSSSAMADTTGLF
jgi:hypothetical protein